MPVPARSLEPHVVLTSTAVAEQQRLLVIEGGEAAGDYVRAGQIVEVEASGARAYMVLASPRTERPRLALLLREGHGAVTDHVAATVPGDVVSMTRPFGPGFALERAAGRALWLCVAGTGVAAVRPVLHELAAERASLAGVHLYYGVRTRRHVAFADEIAAWCGQGLTVRFCLSAEPPRANDERAGHVQDVLAAAAPDLSGAAIVFAGPRAMGPDLEALATGAGMPREMFLKNF